MPASCAKETISLHGARTFKVEYHTFPNPGGKRWLFTGKISDIDMDVQAKLGFPDFDLWSSMLLMVRSLARKSDVGYKAYCRVDGYLVEFRDHGSHVTVHDA